MGCYVLLAGLVAGCAFIIPSFNISLYWPISLTTIGVSLLLVSFGDFHLRTRSPKQWRKLLWGVVLLPILLYIPVNAVLFYAGMVEFRLNDFGAYYNAATRLLQGAPLYQTTQEVARLQAPLSADMPYLYPPIVVLIFIPFTIAPVVLAGILWDITMLLFLVWSVSKLVATFDVDISRRERLLLYVCVASFGPTITWLKLGQISGLLAAFLCLSGAALRTNQHKSSGIFTTLGSVIKPFYATAGAHLLRDKTRFQSALTAGIGFTAVSIILFGLDTHVEYLAVLQAGKGWETAVEPSSWHATHFNPFYIFGPLKHLPRVILVVVTAVLAVYSNKLETPIEYLFALGVAVIPLAGPTTNTLALSTVVPATIMVGMYELEQNSEFPTILLWSTLLIHIHPYTIEFLSKLGPQIYPQIELLTPIIPLLQPALYGSLLLVGYCLYRTSVGHN